MILLTIETFLIIMLIYYNYKFVVNSINFYQFATIPGERGIKETILIILIAIMGLIIIYIDYSILKMYIWLIKFHLQNLR